TDTHDVSRDVAKSDGRCGPTFATFAVSQVCADTDSLRRGARSRCVATGRQAGPEQDKGVTGHLESGGISRRTALIGFLMLGVAGCTTAGGSTADIDPLVLQMYGPVDGEPFRIPAIPVAKVDPQYIRQTVTTPANIASQKPGTIVVDPANKFLYLVQDDGRSLRYGIGVGKAGFAWAGEAEIHDKQHWPKWFPPPEMQERETFQKMYPDFARKYPNGMDGSPRNPLGSRALCLWANNKDTLYRIHATSDWTSPGYAVTSGWIWTR